MPLQTVITQISKLNRQFHTHKFKNSKMLDKITDNYLKTIKLNKELCWIVFAKCFVSVNNTIIYFFNLFVALSKCFSKKRMVNAGQTLGDVVFCIAKVLKTIL